MFYFLIHRIFIVALTIPLPMIGRYERLATAPPWIAYFGLFMLLTYPPVVSTGYIENKDDGLSGLIGITFNLFILALSSAEYAYSEKVLEILSIRGFIGIGLFLFGLILRVWAGSIIGASFSPTVKKATRLIRYGPYKWIRHPMYTGLFFVIVALQIVLGTMFGLSLVLISAIPLILYRIHKEEKVLLEQFQDEYKKYMKESWALFPFFY